MKKKQVEQLLIDLLNRLLQEHLFFLADQLVHPVVYPAFLMESTFMNIQGEITRHAGTFHCHRPAYTGPQGSAIKVVPGVDASQEGPSAHITSGEVTP